MLPFGPTFAQHRRNHSSEPSASFSFQGIDMSRTFDVLERMQQDQELFRVAPVTRPTPGKTGMGDHHASAPDLASFTREEVLRLVQRLFLATDSLSGNGPRRVVFCGIDDFEGSNLLCARIGRMLAEQVQSQVCVVDANVRKPSSSPLFDLLPFEGSSEAEIGFTRGVSRRVSENLWLASGDSVNGSGAGPTLEDVQTWIGGLPAEFAHVVISAPPIGLYTDAALLGQAADGVVLVLEANATRRVAALKAKQALVANSVRVLGTVLNNRTYPIPEKVYRLL
jgi:hypothetical protein